MKTSTTSAIASVALLVTALLGGDDRLAPAGTQWPNLAAQVPKMALDFEGVVRNDLKTIRAHVLMSLGDRNGLRAEHAVELCRLIRNSHLPGGDHFVMWQRSETLLPPIAAFLVASMPEVK